MARNLGTSYCFVAGTLVTIEDGFKPIEEIEVGDRVLSENELTGEVAVKTVTETYVNETDELVHIGVNGETISATPSHPFYVYQFGWTLAGSLKAGDVLVLSNGELVTVEWVQHEILEAPIKVYNFEVEDFHTYFVGESSVLVHNDCTEFYTVQNNVDAERLRNGGVPWPNEPTRAALGEGVYAWGTLDEAEGYLAKIQKEIQVLKFCHLQLIMII